jgi:hypothetical protein
LKSRRIAAIPVIDISAQNTARPVEIGRFRMLVSLLTQAYVGSVGDLMRMSNDRTSRAITQLKATIGWILLSVVLVGGLAGFANLEMWASYEPTQQGCR